MKCSHGPDVAVHPTVNGVTLPPYLSLFLYPGASAPAFLQQ